ncbi:urease accessory protein UreD [Bacillus sp. sid0103]|uniref:urease accessory protein UreD n=1 Tax=Bacillus sp. sid0103 TaxID=2856337 RepID=UPI0027E0AEF3|nr:urease accessory protein UreD [Bacillus sp. sid0103]
MEHWTGYLRLTGMRKGKKTILKESYSEGALKITRPVYLTGGGEAYFYVMNPGGGYVEGDSYKTVVVLEEDAEAVVTTQSSTKIYKTRTCPAIQEMEFHLKSGSILEYLPDPVIAYQHACFKQRTVIRMATGSSLISWDIYTPGWAPDGMPFQYDLLQAKMEIYMDDKLVLFDHVKLQPDNDLKGLGMMEGFSHYGSMIVIDHRINPALLADLQDVFDTLLEVRMGISMLAVSGFALRVLANSTQDIEKVLTICHEIIRTKVLQKEPIFLRKY